MRKTKPTTTAQRARSLKTAFLRARREPTPPEIVIPPDPPPQPPLRLLTLLSSDNRKQYPLTTGVMDYFPDALAAVAHVSFLGNQKHNPGEKLHWSRGKSMDHSDCVMRHLQERGTRDPAGVLHSAQLAWRALALLQEELETTYGLSTPPGATDPA